MCVYSALLGPPSVPGRAGTWGCDLPTWQPGKLEAARQKAGYLSLYCIHLVSTTYQNHSSSPDLPVSPFREASLICMSKFSFNFLNTSFIQIQPMHVQAVSQFPRNRASRNPSAYSTQAYVLFTKLFPRLELVDPEPRDHTNLSVVSLCACY